MQVDSRISGSRLRRNPAQMFELKPSRSRPSVRKAT